MRCVSARLSSPDGPRHWEAILSEFKGPSASRTPERVAIACRRKFEHTHPMEVARSRKRWQDSRGQLGRLHRVCNWTDGCITEFEMEEIWRAVPDGTPIEIRPPQPRAGAEWSE